MLQIQEGLTTGASLNKQRMLQIQIRLTTGARLNKSENVANTGRTDHGE